MLYSQLPIVITNFYIRICISGFHPGKHFCAPRFSLSSLTRLTYSICITSMGASLDFRGLEKFPFKITRLKERRIRLNETLIYLYSPDG